MLSPAESSGGWGASLAALRPPARGGAGGCSAPGALCLLQLVFLKVFRGHPFAPGRALQISSWSPEGSLLPWHRLYLPRWQEPPRRASRSQAGSSPWGTAPPEPSTASRTASAVLLNSGELRQLSSQRSQPCTYSIGRCSPRGGSRCYHHRCHPWQLFRLLPGARGCRCRWGSSSVAPGQSLAALPKAPVPSGGKEAAAELGTWLRRSTPGPFP